MPHTVAIAPPVPRPSPLTLPPQNLPLPVEKPFTTPCPSGKLLPSPQLKAPRMTDQQPTTPTPSTGCCAECGRPLGVIPHSAKNKRFCSARCRTAFHTKELRKFRAALAESKESAS